MSHCAHAHDGLTLRVEGANNFLEFSSWILYFLAVLFIEEVLLAARQPGSSFSQTVFLRVCR